MNRFGHDLGTTLTPSAPFLRWVDQQKKENTVSATMIATAGEISVMGWVMLIIFLVPPAVLFLGFGFLYIKAHLDGTVEKEAEEERKRKEWYDSLTPRQQAWVDYQRKKDAEEAARIPEIGPKGGI